MKISCSNALKTVGEYSALWNAKQRLFIHDWAYLSIIEFLQCENLSGKLQASKKTKLHIQFEKRTQFLQTETFWNWKTQLQF